MSTAIKQAESFVIGKTVYRRHWWVNGVRSDWYEPYTVLRITRLFVFVNGFMENANIRLSRHSLERSGQAYAHGKHPGSFVTAVPEEYRKQTVGYVLRTGPLAVLGLTDKHTADELKAAYREAVKKAHPDAGGSAEEFHRVQAAYEMLAKGPTLGQIMDLRKP